MPAKTVVGLDIGSTRIRGVEATISGNQPNITGVASVALPEGAVERGEIKDATAFANALKYLWKQGKFTSKDVRVVVNTEDNIAKLTTLTDEIDFGKTLPFKLKNKEAFDVDEYYLSYHTIRKYESQEKDSSVIEGVRSVPKRDILLAGAKRKMIDLLVTAFDGADLRPLSVDIGPLAMIRAESNPASNVETDAIDIHLNVGGDMTTIVISNNAQPVYIRIIDIGGNTITDSIAEQLDIDYAYAEKLKLETLGMNPSLVSKPSYLSEGIFGDDDEDDSLSDEQQYTRDQLDAYDVVNDELSAIISNINRTIIYFVEQNPLGLGKNIQSIYVSGGTAAFSQIKLRLTHEIGAQQTILSNPFTKLADKGMISKNIQQQFSDKQHEYTLAVGAILGNGGKNNG